MKSYGIIGHPVSHSLSPKIFTAAFNETKNDATYKMLDISPAQLKDFIDNERSTHNFSGLSVTIPHKENVVPYLDEVSLEAEKIGAVNTLINSGDKLRGENTDWIGVKYALKDIEDIENKTFLMIGAGGASRAGIFALKSMGVKKIAVWNRTPERGQKISKDFGVDFVVEIPTHSDVVINSTPIGLNKEDVSPISDEVLKNSKYVFDMVYGDTNLIQRANEFGCKTIDGREMLLGQAFEQFRLFTGANAPEEIMREIAYTNTEATSELKNRMKLK